jgi:hypothetical protein
MRGFVRVVLFVGFAASAVRAAGADTVRLEYQAPAECPDRATFVEQVLRRASGVRLAAPEEPAPEFRVVVDGTDGGTRARLIVLDGTAPPVERELAGPDCAELVASMAVVIALAIDARVAAPVAEVPAERPAPPAPVAGAPVAPARANGDYAVRLPVRGRLWSLGIGAAVASDIAPAWSPGAMMFSELGLAGELRARLSLVYLTSGELTLGAARARFALLTGRAELCPLALQPARSFWLRPCGGFELGTHQAEGEPSARIEAPKSSSALWLAGELGLRAELEVASFLFVELEAQARIPFLHRTYVFERPDEVAYETPALGVGGQLGVGFPLAK